MVLSVFYEYLLQCLRLCAQRTTSRCRIDEIAVFHPLGLKDLRQIVNIQITQLNTRLKDHNLSLNISDAALDYLAQQGFDPVYGARPLKRTIQQLLVQS